MALADPIRGRHWLLRVRKDVIYDKIETLGKGDFLVDKPVSRYSQEKHKELPPTLRMRAIEYRHGGEKRVLLTSLLDPKRYPADEIIALYRERWEIELGYGELKTDMLERAETIRSKNPDSVAQELWGILVGYNLVRLEMEQIADEIGVPPLRISFIEALDRFVNSGYGLPQRVRLARSRSAWRRCAIECVASSCHHDGHIEAIPAP